MKTFLHFISYEIYCNQDEERKMWLELEIRLLDVMTNETTTLLLGSSRGRWEKMHSLQVSTEYECELTDDAGGTFPHSYDIFEYNIGVDGYVGVPEGFQDKDEFSMSTTVVQKLESSAEPLSSKG